MTTEDALADLTADLLSLRANMPFVEQLLTGPPAVWWSVGSLSTGLSEVTDRLSALPEAADLQACWLDYPQSAYGPGYCVILFFVEDPLWSTAAMYNRSRVETTEST